MADQNIEQLQTGSLHNDCLFLFRDPLEINQSIKDKKVNLPNLRSAIFSQLGTYMTPYSVNSARRDSTNGKCEFITKIDDSTIGFLVDTGSTHGQLTATYPNGSSEISSGFSNISIATNGTYFIIKEFGSQPYATTIKPIENIFFPTSPVSGQLFLDIRKVPYKGYKYNGSSWDSCEFVKFGEVVKASNLINITTGIRTYAYNRFTIEKTPFTFGRTVDHNLGIDGHLYSVETYGYDSTNDIYYPLFSNYVIGGVSDYTYPSVGTKQRNTYAISYSSYLSYSNGGGYATTGNNGFNFFVSVCKGLF